MQAGPQVDAQTEVSNPFIACSLPQAAADVPEHLACLDDGELGAVSRKKRAQAAHIAEQRLAVRFFV